MQTIPVTQASANLAHLIETAAAAHEPVRIAGAAHAAVLVSEEDWRGLQETLYLTAIPGMKESILAADAEPLSECAREIRW